MLLGLILLAAAAVTPAASAQENDGATLTVVVPALNVRSGPGSSHNPVDFKLRGEQASIIGQDAASGWYQVQFTDGTSGWVTDNESYVSVSGRVAQTPAVDDLQLTTGNSQSGTIVFQTEAGGAIYAVNPDGTNLRYLTTGMDPVISPDGQAVAFTRWETSQDGALGNVWLINIDGSGQRVIHEFVYNPRTPVWSADGTQVIIAMQHGGQVGEKRTCGTQRPPRGAYDLAIKTNDKGQIVFCYTLPPDPKWGLRQINVATGAHQDLSAAGDDESMSPAWDPLYGGHVVYDGDYGLMNLDLADQRNWPLTEDFNDHSPVYSPDGTKIALSYRQDDHWEVHVINADGSNRQRLTQTSYAEWVAQQLNGQQPFSHNNASPAWSPDGLQIAFVTDRSGAWEIWLMNADGGNQHPLLTADVLAANGIALRYNGVDERMLSWR
jgi:Tol biopolymer transport system component